MGSLFDSLSEELFQVLKGKGKTLTLYGSDGNKTYDPKKARRVFATPGNLMVSVTEAGSDSDVKLYLSASTDVEEISSLIQILRQITTRYNVMFNVRKFGRELQPKDFAYQVSVTEASMWGSTKTSYQKFGPTKLIIRHTSPVREGVIGSRGRNILSMFVETQQGERFKFPANHLSGGRAFAQHINQGGMPHDTVGTQIAELALESLQLAQTARYIHHNRNSLDESAAGVRSVVKDRIAEIRKSFGGLSRPRGYHVVTEAGLPIKQHNLLEGSDDEVSRLAGILQIDTNHSLAEALKPVALLTLGEKMTNMNNKFQGVIALGEDVADALVEALANEYGHEAGWTRGADSLTFEDENVFEDARGYLDLVEAEYRLGEDNRDLEMEDTISENEMDESYYAPNPYDDDMSDYQPALEALVEHFDVVDFVDDIFPFVKHDEEKEDALEKKYVIANLDGYFAMGMNNEGFNAEKGQFSNWAEELWPVVKKYCEDRGYHFDDAVNEFAEFDERPEHHGVAAGDHVATDFGPGQVVSIEGDLAAVEFLNGSAKTMHVDDLEKVDTLGGIAEEAELAEWFNSFDPESVLEAGFDSTISTGDRVTHNSYGSGEVVAVNGKLAKVRFDTPHARLPENCTVTVSNGLLTKAGSARKEFDEADVAAPATRAFRNAAMKAREASKDGFVQHVDALGNDSYRVSDWMDDATVVSYENGQCISGNDPIADLGEEMVDEAVKKGTTATSYIEWNGEDDVEVEVEYNIDDGSFATGLDHPSTYSYGPVVDIDSVVITATGEDIGDQLTSDQVEVLIQSCIDDAKERHEDALDYKADYGRDERGFDESEEVLGGDQGQDLIDDTKVEHGDEFREELERLIKNAMFRK